MKRNVVLLMIVLVLLALATLAPASPSLAAEIEKGWVEGSESDIDQELTAGFSYAIDGLTVTFTDSSSANPLCPIVLWTWEIGYLGAHFEPVVKLFDLDPKTKDIPKWKEEFDYTFELYGTYNISLTVTDDFQRITVTKGRPRPW